MGIENIRSEFPILNRMAFFNHAGVSPISKSVADAISAQAVDAWEFGGTHEVKWLDSCRRTRESFARLINGSSEHVAIMKNTTEPINLIAAGFPWEKGDNIILTNAEYPANVYPWMNQQERGFEIRFVKEIKGKIELDSIFSQVDSHTKLISMSFVEFATGYRNNLKEIGEFCSKRDIFFVVDAIQGLGVIPFDVSSWKIDAVTTGMHKWLLGPCGVGLFYCHPNMMGKLKQQFVGADAVTNANNYLDYHLTLLPDARRFEYAMLNYTGIAGALAAFQWLDEMGIPFIQSRIKVLTDYLILQLNSKGYAVYSPRGNDEWSGIISCYSDKYKADDLHARLKSNKIYTSVRADRLRISPHYYNNEEDINKLIEVLPAH